MVKCACGESSCPISIRIDKGELWMVSKSKEDTLMYLDAPTTIAFIQELREALGQQVNEV